MNTEPALRSLTDLIVRCLDPEEIVLFGSVGRGRARPDSDIDILVVGKFNGPRTERGAEVRGLMEGRALAVDLQFLTREEYEWESGQDWSFVHMVRERGIVLYQRRRPSQLP